MRIDRRQKGIFTFPLDKTIVRYLLSILLSVKRAWLNREFNTFPFVFVGQARSKEEVENLVSKTYYS